MGFKYGKFSVTILLCLVHGLTVAFTVPENEEFLQNAHYHNTREIQELFEKLSVDYPDLARVHSIGSSNEGRDLTVIENNIQAIAFGYEPSPIQTITVTTDEPVRIDFVLRPSELVEAIF